MNEEGARAEVGEKEREGDGRGAWMDGVERFGWSVWSTSCVGRPAMRARAPCKPAVSCHFMMNFMRRDDR